MKKIKKTKFKIGDKVQHVVDNRQMVIIGLEEKQIQLPAGKRYPLKKLFEKEFVGYKCRHLNYIKEYTYNTFYECELKLSK